MGRKLRYKILVSDRVLTVLYNNGTSIEHIPFIEHKIKVGEIVESGSYVGKVSAVPLCLLAAREQSSLEHLQSGTVVHPKISHCNFRYFERMPGYVAVEVFSKDWMNSL